MLVNLDILNHKLQAQDHQLTFQKSNYIENHYQKEHLPSGSSLNFDLEYYMLVSNCLWLLQCGANNGFIHIEGALYHFFLCLNGCLCLPLRSLSLWMQIQMKLPTPHFHVPIHITMFTMSIRTFPFPSCGYKSFVFSLVGFFLALVLLPHLRIQLNIESLLACFINAFDTK